MTVKSQAAVAAEITANIVANGLGEITGPVLQGDLLDVVNSTVWSLNNLSDLASSSVARTNLGLRGLAVLDAGTGLQVSGTALALASTITGAGPIGSGSLIPIITFNAYGQLVAVTTVAVTLPTPTASILGGVFSAAAPTHQFMTGIDTTGTPQFAQPKAGDLTNGTTGSGAVVLATSPTLSGTATISGATQQALNITAAGQTVQLTMQTNGVATLANLGSNQMVYTVTAGQMHVWYVSSTPYLTLTSSLLAAAVPVGHATYTISTLPAATVAGQIIYDSDLGGGGGLLRSDGTNWRTLENGFNANATTTGAITFVPLTDAAIQKFTTTLTGNLAITYSTTSAYKGMYRRTISPAALGGFTFTASSKSLTAAQWVDHTYDGSAWQETAFGSL